ncbi:acid phosphatase [Diplodia corticola]|uniref:Acid phosphatase n=1 Tax=Diplodia corticola TaxID=236234 RepID=A0A1J9S0E2_9PEZI|nr:acid phosphatase [Diplodia corticola]OJD33492.1 acid phosphatase [Diplodia corticola]
MRHLTSLFEAILSFGSASPLQPVSTAADLRLNHIQVIGTHNSYHREVSITARPIFELLVPSPQSLYYSHASLSDQLDYQSVRSLELDVYADYLSPGQFASPLIDRLAQLPEPQQAWQDYMREPGAKVLHVSDIDVRSVCPTLKLCLKELRDWSDKRPAHVPVVIDLEYKTVDERLRAVGGAPGEPWNATSLGLMDDEIRAALGKDKIITPDDVRLRGRSKTDTHLTLEGAVLQHGWPTLEESRGKFLFVMDNNPDGTPSIRDAYRADGHANLENRVVFTNSLPGEADAAFIKRNDPSGDNLAESQELVRKGYLIRTRADEPINSVLMGDDVANARLKRALETGAQVVSTDWPGVGMATRYGSNYVARLPAGGVVRCNPVNAPGDCNDIDIETHTSTSAWDRLTRQDL